MTVATRTAEETVRVVVIQPHTLMRQGMIAMLETAGDIQVVAHSGSTEDAARLTGDFQPSVAIVDLDLADTDGVRLVASIKEASEDTAVLVMAERAEPSQVERALAEGAGGFLVKAASINEFTEAVRQVGEGELVLHPQAAATLARSFTSMANGERDDGLTPRQREIIELLAQGLQNKQIARRLDIGVETVKTHISRILDRLGVQSRTEAVVIALRDGLVSS